MTLRGTPALLAVCTAGSLALAAGDAALEPGGPIHGVKVLSDQVEDLSTLEAIVAHLAGSATDEDRAQELFRLAVKYRHQITPPYEFLGNDNHAHDPVKIFNVYGYCKCCCSAAMMQALWRASGLRARGWSLTNHSVSEVFYGERWHMYDLSLINYFVTDRGHIASVKEMIEQRDGLINRAHSPFIDELGRFPARAHALEASLVGGVYDVDRSKPYEYPYTTGHSVALSLRQNESITRNWSHKGLHVCQRMKLEYPLPLDVTGAVGSQVYLKDYYPGYAMGLIGNGELVYAPDLASGSYRGGALSVKNIATGREDGNTPVAHLASAGRGEIVLPFRSSYVFLGGELRGRFLAGGPGTVRVLVSLNHGLDWAKAWVSEKPGTQDVEIDLGRLIFRRYHYLIKIELRGPAAASAGIEALTFRHDIQHAQRTLPLLRRGTNRITVSAPNPALTTRTIEASLARVNPENASYLDFHPRVVNLTGDGHLFLSSGPSGTLTFPVEAPGPIRAVRFGGSFRSRDPASSIRLLVSDDGGESWQAAKQLRGPFVGFTEFVRFDRIAPGSRRVLIRYEFNGPGDVGMFVFRIDVDYEDPSATARPVRVSYEWTEGDEPRAHSHLVSSYPSTYTIEVEGNPLMKSIKVEGM